MLEWADAVRLLVRNSMGFVRGMLARLVPITELSGVDPLAPRLESEQGQSSDPTALQVIDLDASGLPSWARNRPSTRGARVVDDESDAPFRISEPALSQHDGAAGESELDLAS